MIRWYWIEYPPRTVVFPSPNQGTCHAKPTAGPKFFLLRGITVLSGLVVSGPTNSIAVSVFGSHVEDGKQRRLSSHRTYNPKALRPQAAGFHSW